MASLKSEKQSLTKSCADLEKIATQIPSVQTPDRHRCRRVVIREPVQCPGRGDRCHPDPVQRFRAGDATARPPATRRLRGKSPAGVVAVPTTLSVTGNYNQMDAFIVGLDSFPRLFVIQTFNLDFGTTARPRLRGATSRRSSASSACLVGIGPARVDRRHPGGADGGTVQPVGAGLDLLHHDTQRPGGLHQGHRGPLEQQARRCGEAGTDDSPWTPGHTPLICMSPTARV